MKSVEKRRKVCQQGETKGEQRQVCDRVRKRGEEIGAGRSPSVGQHMSLRQFGHVHRRDRTYVICW